jgi:hypothetical protein
LKQKKYLLFLPFLWAKSIIKIFTFIKKNSFDYFILGYEEFALYPQSILPILSNFLNIEYEKDMLTPNKTKSHVIRGNTLRGDVQKKAGIKYDARWMTSFKISLLTCFYFFLFFFNRKFVFSNFIKPKIQAFGKKQDDFLVFSNKKKEELISQGWGKVKIKSK